MNKYNAAIACAFLCIVSVKAMELNYDSIDLTNIDHLKILNQNPELCSKVLEDHKDILPCTRWDERKDKNKKAIYFKGCPDRTLKDEALRQGFDGLLEQLMAYNCPSNDVNGFFHYSEELCCRNEKLFKLLVKQEIGDGNFWDRSDFLQAVRTAIINGNDLYLSTFLQYFQKPSLESFKDWYYLGNLQETKPEKFNKIIELLSELVSKEELFLIFAKMEKSSIMCCFWNDLKDKESRKGTLEYILNGVSFCYTLGLSERCLNNGDFPTQELEEEISSINLSAYGFNEKCVTKLPATRMTIVNDLINEHIQYKKKSCEQIKDEFRWFSNNLIKEKKQINNFQISVRQVLESNDEIFTSTPEDKKTDWGKYLTLSFTVSDLEWNAPECKQIRQATKEEAEKKEKDLENKLKNFEDYFAREARLMLLIQKKELLEKYIKISKEKNKKIIEVNSIEELSKDTLALMLDNEF